MNKKILVIEDNPSTLRLIKYCLQQEGYQVLTAPNGLEGIRKAAVVGSKRVVVPTYYW
jgi:two-component system alkaline phosphatase synthesis response regulator PhoP